METRTAPTTTLRELDCLSAAREVAARLLAVAFGDPVRPAGEPRAAQGWLGTLLSRLPADLPVDRSGPILTLGCGWAAATAAAAIAGKRQVHFDPSGLIDLVTSAPAPSADGWRGFVPIDGQWVSLALGPTDADLWSRFVATLEIEGEELGAERIASHAQDWGLACLAAPSAEPAALAATGDGGLPAPSDPMRALGLDVGDPLDGLRVLDLGVLVAAPVTCAVLAGLGADVVAVAHPARVASRWYGPSPIPLDLTRASDRDEIVRLCRDADLVVDNFTPRVWPNWGLDPIAIGARLHLSLPAFPARDRRRNYRAFGFQTEALFGVGGRPPAEGTESIAAPRAAVMDHVVGLAGAVIGLGALGSGRRGRLELSHADVAALVA